MAEPRTDLRVRFSGDLSQFKSSLQSVRTSVTGLKAALGAAFAGFSSAALLGGVIRATSESEQVLAQLEARLKSTAGVAGLTKDELVDMASGLQSVTTYGDEAIITAESMLLTFTKIGRDVFPQALESTLNLATAMGTDLQSAAVQVGKALNDPVKGVASLSKAGIQFTKDQRETIKVLAETGRTAEAQAIILRELETQFGGAARAARNTLGGAFEALKEAAGDLLEGDSGSLDGVRTSIEDLTSLLQSQGVKDGFATMVQGLATIANTATKALSEVANFTRFVAEEIAARVNGPALDDLVRLQDKRQRLRDTDAQLAKIERQGGIPNLSKISELMPADLLKPLSAARTRLQGEIAAIEKQLSDAQQYADAAAERANRAQGNSGTGTGSPTGTVVDPEEAEKAAQKAEKLRAKLKELQAQQDENLRKMREEEIAREEALQRELDGVEADLLRAAGREADAAFIDIDAKYADLLERLKKNSNQKGIELVNELINVEKAKARMGEFASQFDQVLSGFDRKESTLNASASAGVMSPDEAETRIGSARQESLETLQQLRQAAFDYYTTLSGPEAQNAMRSIDEMDLKIAELAATQNDWTQDIAAEATGPLSNFFESVAGNSAKAKDSFKDFVRSFGEGVKRMLAQAAALRLVNMLVSSIGGGAGGGATVGTHHTGGIAGAPRSFARNVNPMLFGAAPRYHSGGIAGLAPDEVPAVLRKGEEVLTTNDPRHRANGGLAAGGTVIQVSTSVSVDASGGAQSTSESNETMGRQVGEAVNAAVTQRLIKEMRPGGLLYGRSNG